MSVKNIKGGQIDPAIVYGDRMSVSNTVAGNGSLNSLLSNVGNLGAAAGITQLLKAGNSAGQMLFNSIEARKNRDWQEYMSSTSYQRAVADMKAAGLNPALLYGRGASGASTPSGSSASSSLGDVVNLSELLLLKEQIKQTSASARLTEAEATGKEIDNETKSTRNQLEIAEIKQRISESVTRSELNSSQIEQVKAATEKIAKEMNQIDAEIDFMQYKNSVYFVVGESSDNNVFGKGFNVGANVTKYGSVSASAGVEGTLGIGPLAGAKASASGTVNSGHSVSLNGGYNQSSSESYTLKRNDIIQAIPMRGKVGYYYVVIPAGNPTDAFICSVSN